MNCRPPPKFTLQDELLKRTLSRCPTCHLPCPGEVWRTGGILSQVLLKRTCPEHGEATVCIASDARFYWLSQGNPQNAGAAMALRALDGKPCGTLGRNAEPGEALAVQEKLSTCLALIEIVTGCNLACPTCYSDSPLMDDGMKDTFNSASSPRPLRIGGAQTSTYFVPLKNIQSRIQGVIDRKGKLEILQLSGGEPTLHPRFFELLRWLLDHPKIDYVLLNTNGVRIANDESFAQQLGADFRAGAFQLYLQFDGVQEPGQKALRGGDLRPIRQRCLDRCQAMDLPVTLAMTVTADNLPYLWEAIEFGLRYPKVRGISFQPMFGSGRVPSGSSRRINTADIILAAVSQSSGRLRFDDFTPLPCGDPNCATIGYLLKVGGAVRSISDFVDFSAVQGFLQDRIRYQLDDLARCGCESEPLGALLKNFELDATHTFRLFIKPFMDAQTWEEDRIDRCCTHVIRPDGKLDSFCRYYSGFPGTGAAAPC